MQLADAGVISKPDQVHFLRREEVLAALDAKVSGLGDVAERRRATWQHHRRLSAPLTVGTLPPLFIKLQARFDRAVRIPGGSDSGLSGVPASPGRAHGPVRIIRSLDDFTRLQVGDVLVAPVTTPAWTPLFSRAAAVVTDTGGVGAHASQVAREYGIPAVVGTGNATARLHEGQLVTVDGGVGMVEI
jgi:pyruvate,water dikinase